MLKRKSFYVNVSTGSYYLCFGWMKWAAQALMVDKVRVGEEVMFCEEGFLFIPTSVWEDGQGRIGVESLGRQQTS